MLTSHRYLDCKLKNDFKWNPRRVVYSSAPSILPPCVQAQRTPSSFLSFMVKFVLYLSLHFEKNENKQKEAVFSPFLKRMIFIHVITSNSMQSISSSS